MKKDLYYSVGIVFCIVLFVFLYIPTDSQETISSIEHKNQIKDKPLSKTLESVKPLKNPEPISNLELNNSSDTQKSAAKIPSWAIGIDPLNYEELYKSWLSWSKTQGPGLLPKKDFVEYTKQSLYSPQGFNMEKIALMLREDPTISALIMQELLTRSDIEENTLKEQLSKLVSLCLLIESTPACRDVHWLYQGYYYNSKEKTLKTLKSLFNSYDQCGVSAPYLLSQVDEKVSRETYQENTPWCF